MYTTETQVTVRYGETDQMGFVYYGNYALYYEVGRNDCVKKLGFPYKQMEANGVMLPVIKMVTDYRKPAKYDDLLTIKTSVTEMPRRTITFKSEVYRGEEHLNTGVVTLIFVNTANGRPMSCPHALADLLKPYFP